MAKRRKKSNKKYSYRTANRVVARTTNRRRLRFGFDARINEYNNRFVESRRFYSPTYISASPRSQSKARISTASTSLPAIQRATTQRIQPSSFIPKKVLVCVRRKLRKEVMHALKHTGKSGQKRPTRNQFSHIKC